MAVIRCPDGVIRDYAEYEEYVKPVWKEQMHREHATEKHNEINNDKMKHIIIGSGVIGKATGELLEAHHESVAYYDIDEHVLQGLRKKKKKIASVLSGCDLYWVCTAEWHVEDAVSSIEEDEACVIVRSTIQPTVLQCLSEKFPSFSFAHVPEFIREKSALQDVFQSDRLVIGTSDKKMQGLLSSLFRSFFIPQVFCSPDESALIKLVSNAWLSMQISFWNEIKELCDSFVSVDPQLVSNAVVLDHRISSYGSCMIGKPFGGFCFPKDTKALLSVFKDLGLDGEMICAVRHVNELLKEQDEEVEVVV
ncbi:MAG: UDP-glucose/GDP-mannose dehydrogenase family protein [Candidatus Thermoplasmatota archaeon]|nr:UDP-glucose/GDP-mannose dehydrogenase family protein [Candidatus Thermoplasmatota archaeon]